MSIRALALDLDGTLAGMDHQVSLRALRILAELDRREITPIIVTGRTEHAATGIARAAGLRGPVISCNGALISTPFGQQLRIAQFDANTIASIRAFSDAHDVELILWTPSSIYASRASESAELLAAINGESVVIDQPPNEPVVKIMVGGTPSELDALAGNIEQAAPSLQRSMTTFYEASPPGSEKWSALSFVLDQLNIRPEQCIGFGDGDTDRLWMSKVGEAVAVRNARPSVLEIASTVIGHHSEDAVATYLAERFSVQL